MISDADFARLRKEATDLLWQNLALSNTNRSLHDDLVKARLQNIELREKLHEKAKAERRDRT